MLPVNTLLSEEFESLPPVPRRLHNKKSRAQERGLSEGLPVGQLRL
jgi:hypothetical protein